ncbi:hypothetical protein BD779DRAFT_855748 [Infundibulicybe gibba]|nr:hypothetical protein BD779DRAFT_855748 [Infundibulicybe gibba]
MRRLGDTITNLRRLKPIPGGLHNRVLGPHVDRKGPTKEGTRDTHGFPGQGLSEYCISDIFASGAHARMSLVGRVSTLSPLLFTIIPFWG